MLFKRNPNFERDLQKDPGYKRGMAQAAKPALSQAKAAAPVRTGDYADSLQIVIYEGGVAVATTDFAGHLVEFGSANNPAYAPLRRGVRAAGMRLDEQ